jgi:hypothetical protein
MDAVDKGTHRATAAFKIPDLVERGVRARQALVPGCVVRVFGCMPVRCKRAAALHALQALQAAFFLLCFLLKGH